MQQGPNEGHTVSLHSGPIVSTSVEGGPKTLGEKLPVAIVVLLLRACGMLWYGVCLLQESVKTQRRLVRM